MFKCNQGMHTTAVRQVNLFSEIMMESMIWKLASSEF